MPTYVRTEKCDGCKGQDKTACMYICPHDLMKLDKDGSENGNVKRFKFPIRTTAEGSIDPFGGKPMPKLADITAIGSFTKDVMGGYRAGNPAELIRK